MLSITILDIKSFMQLLFQTRQLDQYNFISADIRTDITYTLDGHINHDFFSSDELPLQSSKENLYLPWESAKEKTFILIKGKKTPLSLKIVLKASPEQTTTLLSDTKSSLNPNDIDGLYLNIIFQEQKLTVTCGISYNIFTMDKELEHEFSHNFITLLRLNNITCIS